MIELFLPSCRFTELSAILEPGRPMKTDKLAILGDAIRVLNQLKTESQEYKEMNEKLLEGIKTLKVTHHKHFSIPNLMFILQLVNIFPIAITPVSFLSETG